MNILPDIEDRRLAVTTFDKNIVVTAGAGTGKTTLLVDRIIHLLMREPSPLKITDLVALTFTNKAANEMKIRLKARLQGLLSSSDLRDASSHEERMRLDIIDQYRLSRNKMEERALEAINNLEKAQIGTMHSFAGYILRLYPIEAGVDPKFKEDDGSEFEEHFEREWEEWLDVELSSESPYRELWEVVLHQIGLESLKSFAREICREIISIRLLEQYTNKPELSEEMRRWLEGRQKNTQGLLSRYTKSRRIEQLLYKACEAFDGVLFHRDIPIIIEDIPSGPPPTGWSQEDHREAVRTIRTAKRLLSADENFFNILLKLLLPFASRCRERFVVSGNVSFDGLLTFCRNLLKIRPKVREELKRRFKAILVDEFQDTDPVQYEILLYLSEISGRHEVDWRNIQITPGKIFIVGDPKQSIYAFRRADIEAYSRVVERILAGNRGLKSDLSTSFRSHNRIITVVNALFSRMIRRRELLQPEYVGLIEHPDNKARLPVQRVELRLVGSNGEDGIDASTATRYEAEAIGGWLKEEMLGKEVIFESKGNKAVVSPRHIAILLRKLTDVREYIEVLRRYEIPYIVEGERHFYATQEVIDFVNLLKVIDNPCDRLALVGVLRSPLGGLSDNEIYGLKRLSLLDYRIPEEELGESLNRSKGFLTELYRRLKRLNQEIGAMPLPDALSCIFEALPVLEFAAMSSSGEQAVANLLKIQRIAESISDKSNLTLKGFTALLERRVEGLEEEGESLLAEETIDAVRVLSIHKAKGLEFPVAILAGIHSASKGGEDAVDVMYDWSSDEIGLKVDNLRNYAAVMLNERRMIRDEEEQKRLLYVAMTRARECLILSGTLYGRGNRGSFLSMIKDVVGDTLGDSSMDEIMIGEGRIKQTMIEAGDCVPRYSSRRDRKIGSSKQENPPFPPLPKGGEGGLGVRSQEPAEELSTFAELWASRSNRYNSVREKELFISPSRMEDEIIRLSVEKEKITAEEAVSRGRAILIGTMAHHILEQWDFEKDIFLFKEAVEEVCLKFTPVQFINEIASVREELERIFDSFSKSPAYDELKKATIIGKEVPFTIPWDGQVMDGVIDLIYQNGNGVYVADYKTDKVSEGDIEDKIKEYTLSGKIYIEAVRRCLKINVSGFKLIFLRPGRSVSLNLEP